MPTPLVWPSYYVRHLLFKTKTNHAHLSEGKWRDPVSISSSAMNRNEPFHFISTVWQENELNKKYDHSQRGEYDRYGCNENTA